MPVSPDARLLRGLVQGMRCGILAVDRDGNLMMVNRVAGEILGLREPPAPGTPVRAALVDHPRLAELLLGAFGMSNLPNRAELGLGRGDGKTIGFTMSPVLDSRGETLGVALFFKDLTQIEHKAEQERLKDRLAALGEMAASMAHEIRNPLASIEVSCSLLRRRLRRVAGDDPSLDLLEKITVEVRRLDRTIRSSLEYVRPLALSLEPAELSSLLDEAIAAAVGRLRQPGIEIVRRYAAALPPFLMDREQLRQVFENLIVNAIEANGERGTVTIEAELLDPQDSSGTPCAGDAPDVQRYAVVRVSDTGPGIGEQEKSRIFFPFYTTKKQGSGVGLALAKKIVNGHRGLIDVDDAPAGGAQFIVRLPMLLETAED